MTDSDSLFQPVLLVQIKHSPGKPVFKPCLHYVIMFNSLQFGCFFFYISAESCNLYWCLHLRRANNSTEGENGNTDAVQQ